jgi:hypothetical protein
MTSVQIALIVLRICSLVVKRYRQFDDTGGDVIGIVFESIQKSVEAKPESRGNEQYVLAAAQRQAQREYRKLLAHRLRPIKTEEKS